jgi:hypothetical protein
VKRRILSQHAPFTDARYVAALTNLRGWVVLDTGSSRTIVGAGTLQRALEMARELSNQELEKHPRQAKGRSGQASLIRRALGHLFRRSGARELVADEPRPIRLPAETAKPDNPRVDPDPVAERAPHRSGVPAKLTRASRNGPYADRPGSDIPSRRTPRRMWPQGGVSPASASPLPGGHTPDVRVAAKPKAAPVSLSPGLVDGIRSTNPVRRREARIRLLEACLPPGALWKSEGGAKGFTVWIEDANGERLHEVRRKSLDAALLRSIQDAW